ncbi:MAG: sulfite exporter TauE/SafE family protein [Candidatus Dojkabacteria bacterium]|nr:MAG: sulfite exporter TauE/SafE family protein [Candidatus Dojkabacteria bacterium]
MASKGKKNVAKTKKQSSRSKEQKYETCEYYVDGMHCAACELLIEKKILKKYENVGSVDASLADGVVRVSYQGTAPDPEKMSQLFKEDKYYFSTTPEDIIHEKKTFQFDKSGNLQIDSNALKRSVAIIAMAGGFLLLFFGIEEMLQSSGLLSTGIESLMEPGVDWTLSAYFVVLITGLIAGFSSCASLVGGLLLSMSKQWNALNNKSNDTKLRAIPYVMFNVGRLIAFPLFGALLGLLGSRFGLSLEMSSLLVLAVGVLMFALGGQMLGWKRFRGVSIRAPKFVTDRFVDESKFNGKVFPFLVGMMTIFLPCGFTALAMTAAVLSGDPLTGALVMLLFALGTLPALIGISVLSIYSDKSVRFGSYFTKVAGYVVVYFGLASINAQFKVLGVPSLSSVTDIYSLIEFGVFLTMFATLITLIIRNLGYVKRVDGAMAKIYRLMLAFIYLLLFVSFMVSYNLIMPWEYDFTKLS